MIKKLALEMQKAIALGILFSSSIIYAQVGINTGSPASTFDVQVKNASDSQSLDGVIAPRLLGSQLSAKSYTTAQTGAIVYITDASATLTGQTINVSAAGYYYFDGTVWRRMLTTIANNSWLLADIAFSSVINGLQNLNLVTIDSGPYEEVWGTTLTVTVPTGYSQNKVVLRWDIWGSTNKTNPGSPAQGSLRYAIKQQAGSTTNTIGSIMMSGWVNVYNDSPRFNAPVVITFDNLAPGTYKFDLMVHREAEENAGGVAIWGNQGKGDVYVK